MRPRWAFRCKRQNLLFVHRVSILFLCDLWAAGFMQSSALDHEYFAK